MNVLLISQCTKSALTETRRILDNFAERRGDRTWQTAITKEGLNTLHRLLSRTARKNTAIACHWIHGKDYSELLWIIGDSRQFNEDGTTPTNITGRDILRIKDENDWQTTEEIRLFASLASLFHDFGKANKAFQNKLKNARQPIADAYRHEWVSLRIFEALAGNRNDEEWLNQLAGLSGKTNDNLLSKVLRDGIDGRLQSPFVNLPPLAQVIGWLIVSHHRIPTQTSEHPLQQASLRHLPKSIEDYWCSVRSNATINEIEDCWTFEGDIPFFSHHWQEHTSKIAQAILQRKNLLKQNWLADPYVLHLSRMALMLGDHHYSSQPSHSRYGDANYALYANTDKTTGELKQRLDEHLIGVKVTTSRIVRTLPRLTAQLPRLARHKGFRQRSKDNRFRWQDKAFELAETVQLSSSKQGFFGINMASTGCGKTLANGKILYGISDPKIGSRFTIALGLRTLTLQTGDTYREKLGLVADNMAILTGGDSRALHEFQRNEAATLGHIGSESVADLHPEYNHVYYEGSLEDGPLKRWLDSSQDAQRLINAPILVCTIDHLMPATEGTRGGHQIPPMLRLMTSDLILDEPDDFATEDLPALTRLVNWAGMLGSRILLSSATLPPSLIQALFQAYQEGRRHFQRNRADQNNAINICCAWFDEFASETSNHSNSDTLIAAHQSFVSKRLEKLAEAEIRRKAEIKTLSISQSQDRNTVCNEMALNIQKFLHELHSLHHTTDPHTGKRLSFGLIRLANIDPLVEIARALFSIGADDGTHIHLCVYHSHHPILIRSEIERNLDKILNRKLPEAIFNNKDFRKKFEKSPERDHVFVVLATAVAEVGRDHDYDWAIVEPSSMRSIIQLAGRIRRHRPGKSETANLYLLETNIRHLIYGQNQPAFCRPGFESKHFPLKSHKLTDLLTPQQLAVIDATSRIRESDNPQPQINLADLEHARLRDLLIGATTGARQVAPPVHLQWTTRASLSGELQRKQPFRHDPLGRQRYGLLPNDNGEITFCRFESDGRITPVRNLLHPIELHPVRGISVWGETDYEEALNNLAESMEIDISICARRFGIIDLPVNGTEQGWHFHPALGFSRFQ